ncbi:MAG: ParB/RepB/Spo0J family partition protein [Deltaproteobacteria bacterium]|nr:ParB/RepB/Spo0J family partition protein [Deltaproteobacteria bacterium]
MEKRKVLGRGLDALIPTSTPSIPARASVLDCPIEDLRPQHGQPRKAFDEERLEELTRSIREQGVIQPIIARRLQEGRAGDPRYEIIAGERRWRAAQRAGLQQIPVILREATTQEAFELALIENLQREDLNPIEAAEALQRLLGDQDLTQEDLARRVGKDRSTVANTLRLLKLPAQVRELVATSELSAGHARALLSCADQATMSRLATRVMAEGLSVRATEALVRASLRHGSGRSTSGTEQSASVRDLVARLQRAIGAKVQIRDRKGKGRVEIAYASYDDLDRIIEKMLG